MKLEVQKARAAAVAAELITGRVAQEACGQVDELVSLAEEANHEIHRRNMRRTVFRRRNLTMKEKANATLRRAASLRCRTDAAIARLGRAIACYQRGAITTVELLREASAAIDRAGSLELSAAELAATGSFGRSVNRKVANYRNYICTAARIAMGYKSNAECRRQALAFARTAARLGNRRTAFIAHDLLWAAAGGLPDEAEFAAFEACERV